MRTRVLIIPALMAAAAITACTAATATPSPTPSPAPTSAPVPTPTALPTVTAAPSPTPTPTPPPSPTAAPSPTPTAEAGWRQVGEGVWEGKVRMTLWVRDDDSVAAPGQEIRLRAVTENLTGQPVEYTMWNKGDPAVYTWLEWEHGESFWLRNPRDPSAVLPAVAYDTLAPREQLAREVVWDGKVPTAGGPIPAPNGKYKAVAALYLGRYRDYTPEPAFQVPFDLEVQGGVDLIGSGRALRTAEGQQSVRLWRRAHSPESVTRKDGDGFWVSFKGQWVKVDQAVYEQVRSETPQAVTILEPAEWVVRWASKYGFTPDQIEVRVNHRTGAVVSVTPNIAAEMREGVLAVFEVQGQPLHVYVTDRETIAGLERLRRGEEAPRIPNGPLVAGPGAGLHNAPWSWHLDPARVRMADITIELCDGTPAMVEADLAYWTGTVKSFCPWGAKLVDLEDFRPAR